MKVMMKFVVLMMFVSTSVFADKNVESSTGITSSIVNQVPVTTYVKTNVDQDQFQGQLQGQMQGQGQMIKGSGNSNQDQGQSQNVNDSGNSTNTIDTNANAHGGNSNQEQQSNSNATNAGNSQSVNHYQVKQHHNTPNLASMFAYPTAPCALPVGGTGAGAGFGFGFNTAYINQECVKSETAKLAMALGKVSTASEVFCSMEHAANTLECLDVNEQVAQRKLLVKNSREVKMISNQVNGNNSVEILSSELTQISSSSSSSSNSTSIHGEWKRVNDSWVFVK